MTKKFVSDFNERTGNKVQYLEAPYEPNEYRQLVRGLEEEPEGGDRCKVCFDYRLDKTAQVAMDLGFDYFGSALTISPHKNSQTINSIGIDVQKIYTTHYLPSDFKKNQGYKRSVEMCEEYDILSPMPTVACLCRSSPEYRLGTGQEGCNRLYG